MVCICGFLSHDRQARAQNLQSTHNTADEALKSDMRVDPTTLGLNITIPLGSYPGRAGLNVPVGMSYSSKGLWHMEYSGYYSEGSCCAPSFTANPQGLPSDNNYSYVSVSYGTTPGVGWGPIFRMPEFVDAFGAGVYNFEGDPCPECEPDQRFYVLTMRVMMPDGSTHELRRSDTVYVSSNRPNDLGTYIAVDGSRLRFVEGPNATGTLYLPDGSRYLMGNQPNKYIDRNGNTLAYNSNGTWTDTLGRTVGLVPANTPATPTSDQIFTLTGVGGAARTYVFRYKYLSDARGVTTVYTTGDMNVFGQGFYPGLFHSDGGTRVTPPTQFNPPVLTEIELPNGTKYKFSYNEYGEVEKVVYPTGGYERYAYDVIPGLDPVNAPYDQTNRGVMDRWVSPSGSGGDEQHTHYAVTTSPEYKVTITNPNGTYTERRLLRGRGPGAIDFGFDDSRAGMAYDERFFSASGQMLRRKLTEWSQSGAQSSGSLSATATRDPRVTKEVQFLLDTGGGDALSKTITYQYDADLNVKSASEYDYAQVSQATAQGGAIGSFAPGALLRTTEATFLVNDAAVDPSTRAAYRARNLVALPTSTRVRDAAGALVAQTETRYDEYDGSAYPLVSYGAVTGWADPATAVRGNATTVRRWLDTAAVWVETHAQYDQCGSAVGSWDANGNKTQVDYSSTYAYAYPTSVTTAAPNPVAEFGYPAGTFGSTTGLTSSTVYDASTGFVTSTTDANGKTTTFDYSDPLNRLKRVDRPDGGRTMNTYVDSHQCGAYIETRTLIDSSGRQTDSYQFFDGLGRPYISETYDGQDASNVWLRVDTRYDSVGRVSEVSSPYRSAGCAAVNPSIRWTTTTYDALGRAKSVTTPDGAIITTSYIGNIITVTDQAGKKRSSVSDALGRLVQVTEDPTAGGLNYPTAYTYDALGNLRKVDQGGQPRFFMYDSLSRLIRAKNPEQSNFSPDADFPAMTDSLSGTSNSQWSLGYTYDASGNLLKRKDARGVVTSYQYDHLNRNITVRYADSVLDSGNHTKDVDRQYDGAINGRGRFYRFNFDPNNNNSRFDSQLAVDEYDEAGRVRKYRQHFLTNGVASPQFTVTRAYDLAGNVVSQTYPSGRTVSYAYDEAGRLSSFAGNLGDGVQRAYSSRISYGELGGMQEEQFGTQTPLYNKRHYNVRGQLFDVRLSAASWATDQWAWDRGAILNFYSAAELGAGSNAARSLSGADNNGNLLRQTTLVPLSAGVTYTEGPNGPYAYYQDDYAYDPLNRLSSVTETPGTNSGAGGPAFTQAYTYDRWGNRTIDAAATQVYGQNPNYTIPETQYELQPQTNQEVSEPSNRLYAPGDAGRAPAQKLMRYDAAGNLTYDAYTGQGVRAYDAEERMTQAQDAYQQWSVYTYDADGRRVKRQSARQETWQVYGPGDELLAEYRAGSAPMTATKEYGYRGGELLVTMSSGDDQRLKRFVTYLYYGALRRDPTAQELQNAMNQLADAGAQGQGQLLQKAKDIARSLFLQTSYETSPARSDAQYVADLYYAYLQRGPDDSGLGYWTSRVPTVGRANVCNGFQESSEFAALVSTLYGAATSDIQRTEQFVTDFYLGAYGRFPTAAELQQQRDALNSAAAQGFSQVQGQAEALGRALFAGQVNDYSLTDQQFVTNLYEGFLQRGPDTSGLNFWAGLAAGGPQNRQNVLNLFATSPPFRELSGTLYRETFWLVDDQLGTPRMVADRTGSLAGVKRHDYLPFGEELYANVAGRAAAQGYGANDNVRQKFTSKEQDSETGLNYYGARYYSSAAGRFIGVDPGNYQAMRDLNAPQSWNAYAYVNNNPLVRTDPDGRGFFTRMWNKIRWGVWGEEVDVQREEDRRRAVLTTTGVTVNGVTYLIVAEEPHDINSFNRQEIWDLYDQHVNNEGQRLSQDEVNKILQSIPPPGGTSQPQPTPTPPSIPQHAQNTLNHIEGNNGSPPPGFKGGGQFLNDGRGGGQILPKTDGSGNPITYREYDVNPYVKGMNRGGERIVRGSDGSAYYTADHYQTFTKIK